MKKSCVEGAGHAAASPRELAADVVALRPRMHAAALRILRDHDEAEDAVQDSLVSGSRRAATAAAPRPACCVASGCTACWSS